MKRKNKTRKLLEWPCNVCGRANMYHEVFILSKDKYSMYYQAQYPREDGIALVSQHDHYTQLCSNLEMLEWKANE